jgi:hypothetical protein
MGWIARGQAAETSRGIAPSSPRSGTRSPSVAIRSKRASRFRIASADDFVPSDRRMRRVRKSKFRV